MRWDNEIKVASGDKKVSEPCFFTDKYQLINDFTFLIE